MLWISWPTSQNDQPVKAIDSMNSASLNELNAAITRAAMDQLI